MTGLTRTCKRQTGFIDYRTGMPAVVELTPHFIRIRAKGSRKPYTVTWKEIWCRGAANAAAELRAAKKARQIERRKLREGR